MYLCWIVHHTSTCQCLLCTTLCSCFTLPALFYFSRMFRFWSYSSIFSLSIAATVLLSIFIKFLILLVFVTFPNWLSIPFPFSDLSTTIRFHIFKIFVHFTCYLCKNHVCCLFCLLHPGHQNFSCLYTCDLKLTYICSVGREYAVCLINVFTCIWQEIVLLCNTKLSQLVTQKSHNCTMYHDFITWNL